MTTRTTVIKTSVLASLLFALCLAGCGVEGTSFFVSDQQEAELGAEVHQQILTEYTLYEDPTVSAWVADLGGRLAAASEDERSGVNYQFFVLDADFVNAFAAPGGYVYLTRTLITEASNEAMVAGVLGHEVGHIAHRHGVAKMERALLAGVVSELFFGDGSWGEQAIEYATTFVLSTDYSQDQENDSDELGVQFAFAANINPFGLVDFFYYLASISGETSVLDEWLSSHPQPLDRAEASEELIEQIHPGFGRDTQGYDWDVTGDFAEIQTILAY